MITVMKKTELKDGYYYSGYIVQQATCISDNEIKIVCMWDEKNNCFWFWEFEANRKTKSKLSFMSDIDNEIEYAFFPIKETFPKEEHLIE